MAQHERINSPKQTAVRDWPQHSPQRLIGIRSGCHLNCNACLPIRLNSSPYRRQSPACGSQYLFGDSFSLSVN